MRNRRRDLRPALVPLDDRRMLSGLTPALLSHAYGLDAISFTSPSGATVPGNGSGETIAIIEAYHDPTLVSDLAVFDQTYNLPATTPTVVNLGGARSNPGWALEESLDVEWAHAIAPGANLVVIEAKAQTRSALLAAVDTARYLPGVDVVSMSWGFGEVPYESSSHFTTPAGHTGITFVAASGDNGLAGGTNWPAVSPNVLAVGGTSLVVDNSGDYQYESAWYDSGGGFSRFDREPAYQRIIQATGKRGTPDVAFDGDPNSGVEVYQTSTYSGQGSWSVVGGTSLGTPAWAAIIAIVDQGRALQGKGSLDGASQTLPMLYSLPSTAFNSVSVSSHADVIGGANLATGLGSPDGPTLIADLVASNLAVPLTTSGAAGSGSNFAVHFRDRKSHFAKSITPASRHQPAGLAHETVRASTAVARHAAQPLLRIEHAPRR
jgi:hypothetical protein